MDELLEKYIKTFGEGFPMYQIGRNKSDNEIMEIIQQCLEKNKTAYDLGFTTDDLDVLY